MIAETDPQNPPIAYLTILKNSVYSIDQFAFQLEALSTRFRGDLWVVGPEDKVEVVGRFVVHVVKRKAGESKPALFWRLYSNILQRARDIQGSVPEPKVVVTYDPFRQGLLAAMIKRAIGWPTILEVNGAWRIRRTSATCKVSSTSWSSRSSSERWRALPWGAPTASACCITTR
ncbi:MAG: hypothetical protein U0Q11_22685 [Vicinamibacterales bacterium]